MSQDWIIDVLADLKSFAQKNQLDRLSEQLDDTIHVAVSELNDSASNQRSASNNGSTTTGIDRADRAC